MEMTIEEAMYLIEHHKLNDINNAYELGEAFCVVVDILHRYQKIEQILKEPCIIPEGCYPMLKKIKRVVEDGTND